MRPGVLVVIILHIVSFLAGWVRGQLMCYDCMETFKKTWNPYTDCQANVSAVPVATCLDTDQYCKVERVSVKGATISITRGCAGECYYGCHMFAFGVTQLRCTSCCNTTRCNVGSGARSKYLPLEVLQTGRHAVLFQIVTYFVVCIVLNDCGVFP